MENKNSIDRKTIMIYICSLSSWSCIYVLCNTFIETKAIGKN